MRPRTNFLIDAMVNEPSTYSKWQTILLYSCFCVSASLSLLGSSSIITIARRKLRRVHCHNHVFQRLMIAIGVCDIAASVTYLISPWLLPPTPNNPMARGTDVTCTVSGMFVEIVAYLPCVNGCFLSLYFLLTIKYGWREQDIKQRLEVPSYVLEAVVVLGLVVWGLAMDLHAPNPSALLCWPMGETVWHHAFTWVYTITQLIFAGVGITATYMVYRHVFLVTEASRTHDAVSSAFQASVHFSTNTVRRSSTMGMTPDQRQKRVQKVAKQAVLYTLALMNTIILPIFLNTFLAHSKMPAEAHKWYWFTLTLLGMIVFPLNGMFNFLIYSRGRVMDWKKAHPEVSLLRATWWAVAKPEDPPHSRMFDTSHTNRPTQETRSSIRNSAMTDNSNANMATEEAVSGMGHGKSNDNSVTNTTTREDAASPV